jgi:hypothetical protein
MGTRSQRTQIIRHVTEPPDHLGVAEIARSGITRAAIITHVAEFS